MTTHEWEVQRKKYADHLIGGTPNKWAMRSVYRRQFAVTDDR